MPRVSDIIIPDNRRRNSEQIMQAMQMYNIMKEQLSARLRAEQEERRRAFEEKKYNKEEIRMQQALRNQIDSQTMNLISSKLDPEIKLQRKTWDDSHKTLSSVKSIQYLLKKGMDDNNELVPTYLQQALKGLEAINERRSGRNSTAMMQGEIDALEDTTMSKLEQWIKYLSPFVKHKAPLSKKQAQELYNDLEVQALEEYDAYDNSLSNYKEKYNKFKNSVNPDSPYGQAYFNSGEPSIGHENNLYYNYYGQIKSQKEEEARKAEEEEIERRIQNGIVQQNNAKTDLFRLHGISRGW